jgi:peptidyl-prolyl cis-trans isomerase A (cyclophilin A)
MEMLKTIATCLTGAVLLAAIACTGPASLTAQEPKAAEDFYVKFETSKGDVILEVHPEWAPIGAAHFKELVEAKFYDECRFFRVLKSPRPFMAQVGMHGDPKVQAKWGEAKIKDDPVKKSNKRGFVTYATSGRNSRSTQIFFNYADNSRLDADGFSPFAIVIRGMSVLDSLYGDYGEGGEGGPTQDAISRQGNEYLTKNFPKLDYIKTARIISKADAEVK